MTSSVSDQWISWINRPREALYIYSDPNQIQCELLAESAESEEKTRIGALVQQGWACIGILPPIYPEWLGSRDFLAAHQVRLPYVVGEMANGIATARMVIAAVQAGMMGFFGAGGLIPNTIEKNLQAIQQALPPEAATQWGSNLIHSPQEPLLEKAAVELYLRYGVKRVSASAYMSLNPNLVLYACKGLHTTPTGEIVRPHQIFAKISRPEVARLFMMPAPAEMVASLVQSDQLTEQEAALAAHLPLAQDITVEADSGGHTDNRPLVALFPTIAALAEQLKQQYAYPSDFRLGAAGGLGTPSSVAAAFGLGAAYVLTGSINQSAVESGLSEAGKILLAKADIASVMMAPAADMFELGVKLQVLRQGTLFGMRASKLYELYREYDSLEAIPAEEKKRLEQQILGQPIAAIWEITQAFFRERDPGQLARAETDPKHRMALVFRWYLGLSSRWAIQGEEARVADYQIWCGPAMGAFNAWVAGSPLEALSARTVAQIGWNLMEGAAVIQRAQQLRSLGFPMPAAAFDYKPRLFQL